MRSHLRSTSWTLLLLAGALVLAAPVRGETRVGGELKGETRWTAEGSPYIATADVVIPRGSTLTIDPGVTVRFKGNINDQHGENKFDLELIVHGTLVAHGAERDTIYFLSDETRTSWMDWHGIMVRGEGALADLKAVNISHANVGVRCQEGRVVLRDVTVNNCSQYGVQLVDATASIDNLLTSTIGNPGGTGIGVWLDRGATAEIRDSFFVGVQNGVSFSRGSGGKVVDSVITLCVGGGLMIRNSSPTIEGCTITGNEYGLDVSAGAEPVVKHNNVFNNGNADLRLRDYDGAMMKLDFSNNWWGSDNLSIVEENVLDALDDPSVKAIAVLDPILTEAVTREGGEGAGR